MTAIMDTPYSIDYPVHEVTVFAFMRSVGADLQTAFGVQLLISIACVIVCLHVWKPGSRFDPIAKVCLTAVLTVLATPYGHDYDCVPIAAGLMYVFFHRPNIRPTVVLAAFLLPIYFSFLRKFALCLDPVLPLLLSSYFVFEATRPARTTTPHRPTV